MSVPMSREAALAYRDGVHNERARITAMVRAFLKVQNGQARKRERVSIVAKDYGWSAFILGEVLKAIRADARAGKGGVKDG